jgi:TetR/AcrR family transcriptional repressor of nem operon
MSRKATDTKERILRTATNLFSTHGYTATSIDDVISAVGITKGAFYHYFNGKEHLCEMVLDEAMAAYRQLADSLQDTNQADVRLSLWLSRLIERQTSGEWLYCRLLSRLSIESSGLSAEVQNKLKLFWQWCQSFYESLIRQAMTVRKSPAPVELPAMARLYMAAQFGAMWLDRCAPSSEDLTRVSESLLKLTFTEKP